MSPTGVRLQWPANKALDVPDPTERSREIIQPVGMGIPQFPLPVECLPGLTCGKGLNSN